MYHIRQMYCIILIIILLVLLLDYLYIHSKYYRYLCLFENRIEKPEKIPDNLQVINLGSGYARFSFTYEELALQGYNFAQSPQCLEYDFKLLKRFSNNLSKGCIVFINLPIFIFSFKRYEIFEYNMKYYGCLKKNDIDEYSYIKYLIATKFPVLNAGKRALHIFYDKRTGPEIEYEICQYEPQKVLQMVEEHYQVWIQQFKLKDTVNSSSCEHLTPDMEYTTALLEKMIDYCLSQKWKPILITTPLCRELNEKFSNEFLNTILYDNIKKANKAGIPYLDFRECVDFQNNRDYFWNGVDWLSKSGRKHFMALLLDELDNYK